MKLTWKQKRMTHMITIVLALLVAFVLCYLVGYEASHEIHTCTGEDCPICHELQIAQTMIKQLGAACIGAAIAVLSIFAQMKEAQIISGSVLEQTLITLKVRLDD